MPERREPGPRPGRRRARGEADVPRAVAVPARVADVRADEARVVADAGRRRAGDPEGDVPRVPVGRARGPRVEAGRVRLEEAGPGVDVARGGEDGPVPVARRAEAAERVRVEEGPALEEARGKARRRRSEVPAELEDVAVRRRRRPQHQERHDPGAHRGVELRRAPIQRHDRRAQFVAIPAREHRCRVERRPLRARRRRAEDLAPVAEARQRLEELVVHAPDPALREQRLVAHAVAPRPIPAMPTAPEALAPEEHRHRLETTSAATPWRRRRRRVHAAASLPCAPTQRRIPRRCTDSQRQRAEAAQEQPRHRS